MGRTLKYLKWTIISSSKSSHSISLFRTMEITRHHFSSYHTSNRWARKATWWTNSRYNNSSNSNSSSNSSSSLTVDKEDKTTRLINLNLKRCKWGMSSKTSTRRLIMVMLCLTMKIQMQVICSNRLTRTCSKWVQEMDLSRTEILQLETHQEVPKDSRMMVRITVVAMANPTRVVPLNRRWCHNNNRSMHTIQDLSIFKATISVKTAED